MIFQFFKVILLSEKEEKLVVRKATLNLRRKYGRSKQITIVERDAFIPNSIEKEIKESLSKRKSILAYDIALKYDLRISTVNRLLKQYEEEGLIKLKSLLKSIQNKTITVLSNCKPTTTVVRIKSMVIAP